MRWLAVATAVAFIGLSCGNTPRAVDRQAAPSTAPVASTFQQRLEAAALQYFLENTNPETGLTRDRARNVGRTENVGDYPMASIAATGFGMAVLANAASRGLISSDDAHNLIARGLTFATQKLERYRGWFYHFVDWETGERWGDCEISTIDTALFLAGALYAGQIFRGSEIETLANALYADVNFVDMMTDGGTKPDKRTVSMGWKPETGYLPWQWDGYAEQTVLLFLGLGHPRYPLPPESWKAWSRSIVTLPTGEKFAGVGLPLFGHQYSQLFLDLRTFDDDGFNYFLNSTRAVARDRATCSEANQFETYRKGFWGLSASDSADGYQAFSPERYDGTVCLACSGASAMFAPDTLADLERWSKSELAQSIWGRYGFIDSFNLDRGWFDSDVIGITVGPLFLSLANTDEKTALWPVFGQIEAVRRAFAVAEKNRISPKSAAAI